MVGEDLCADGHGEGQAKEEAEGEEPETERTEAAGEHVEQGPGEAVGENEAGITAGSGVVDGAGPAELMIEEAAPAIGGDGGLYDFSAECDAVACLRNAGAEFVVVGEVVDEGQEAADFVEGFAADRERGSEAVVQVPLNHFGEQNAGLEVGGDAEGLKARWEGGVRAAAVESGDQAGWELGSFGGKRAEVVHDAFKITG